MKPGKIHGSNFIFKAPPGIPGCCDLPVMTTTHQGLPIIRSAWILDDAERAAIANGQDIILTVVGTSIPPLALEVAVPNCDFCEHPILKPEDATPSGTRHRICNEMIIATMTDEEKEAAKKAFAEEIGDILRSQPDKYVELNDGKFLPVESVKTSFEKLTAELEAARRFAVDLLNGMGEIPDNIEQAARTAGVIE